MTALGDRPIGERTTGSAPHDALDNAGTISQRRDRALREARQEAAATTGEPVIAVRPFATDAAVLALGGDLDPAAVERLETTLRDLRRVASGELVVDTGALHRCDRRLGRVLTRARMQSLVAGARVEWHHVPTELAEELHATGPGRVTAADGATPKLASSRADWTVPGTDAAVIADGLVGPDRRTLPDNDRPDQLSEHQLGREEATVAADDKIENKAEELKGKAKQTAGRATDDEELQAEGKAEQTTSNIKQAGEKVKDAVKGN